MRREQETRQLVEEFASRPGVESEDVEFKSKEIVETPEGRRKLVKVLSAMANQGGGTVIVGVRREPDEQLLLQGFPVDSEVIQHLTHTAIEYTAPPVTELVDHTFVEYSGKLLLRIDVGASTEKPVEYNDSGEFVPWIRIGDGMEKMTSDQMIAFFQERARQDYSLFSSDVEKRVTVSLDIDTQDEVPSFKSPPNWLVTSSKGPRMFVFGEGGLAHDYGKAALFHLEGRIDAQTPDEIADVIDWLEGPIVEPLIPSRFGYAIEFGDRQVIGRGHRWFVEDLTNIDDVIDLLEKSHSEPPRSEPPDSPRPVAVGYISCPSGIFWIETQLRGEHFGRTRCGFVFTDIPFDNGPYWDFFAKWGRIPEVYEQQRGLQIVTIRGSHQHLGNPEVIDISSHPGAPEFMLVDNPFYHRTDELEAQIDGEIPPHILKPLEGINRLPLDIAGGYTEEEERVVELDSMTLFSKNLTFNTLFLSGVCRQRSN